MVTGETFLKITDFPFSYSILAIIFGTGGVSVSFENILQIFSIASVAGTSLAILDPIGKSIKIYFAKKIMNYHKENNHGVEKKFMIRSLHIHSIGIEINKIVTMIYFLIIIYAFILAINISESFASNLQIFNTLNNVACDVSCVQFYGTIFAYMLMIPIIYVLAINLCTLKTNLRIAGIYCSGISSPYVVRNTIENMSKAIAQNDWRIADEWGTLVRNEITNEKNRQEFNTNAAQQVYIPLSTESNEIRRITMSLHSDPLGPTFPIIQLPSTGFKLIKDPKFKQMISEDWIFEKIYDFYVKIDNFNKNPGISQQQIHDIIVKEARKFYNSNDIEDVYYLYHLYRGFNPPLRLLECIMNGKNPEEFNIPSYDKKYVDLKSIINGKEIHNKISPDNFNEFWNLILKRIKNELNVEMLKSSFEEIIQLNSELRPIYNDRISKQWV